jgi:hypothetical protein
MCELFTVAGYMITVMDVVAVAGAGMAAMSAMNASQARADTSGYQAAVERNNRIIADRNKVRILEQGKYEANEYRQRTRGYISDQMVLMAAQGADISYGSNVDLLADTAELGERDAQTIEANAAQMGYEAELEGYRASQQADLYATQAANEDPLYAGVSTLFSTGSTVAHRWALRTGYGS